MTGRPVRFSQPAIASRLPGPAVAQTAFSDTDWEKIAYRNAERILRL